MPALLGGQAKQKGTRKEILIELPSSDYWQASFGHYLKHAPIVLATLISVGKTARSDNLMIYQKSTTGAVYNGQDSMSVG